MSTTAIATQTLTGPLKVSLSVTNAVGRAHPVRWTKKPIETVNPDSRVAEVIDTFKADGSDYSTTLSCREAGSFDLIVAGSLSNFAGDNAFFSSTLKLPPLALGTAVKFSSRCLDQSSGPQIDKACIVVVHQASGDLVSYLDTAWSFLPPRVRTIEITIQGANNDQPANAVAAENGAINVQLGLHNAGTKTIKKVMVGTADGQQFDVTDQAIAIFGETFEVPYPAQPTFGVCPG